MKIGMVCYGTLGDIMPFVVLAKRLLSAGHTVRMCSHSHFSDLLQSKNFEFVPVGNPFDQAHFNYVLDKIIEITDPVENILFFVNNRYLPEAKKWYEDCREAVKGCDVVVLNNFDLAGQEAASVNNIPWVTFIPCPGYVPTAYYPPLSFPQLGRWINPLSWFVLNRILRKIYDVPFNNFLRSINRPERRDIANISMYSKDLNLIGASPALCTEYPDRPNNFKFTGAWIDRYDSSYVPSKELEQFLKAGSPPIVVSFSSMGGTHGNETAKTIVEVIESLNERAIIQKGWLEMVSHTDNPNIFFAPFIPHSYLFRYASLVIQHGGAGTTQTACAAGVPSIIIPFLGDQFYWGKLLHEKKLGPPMIPISKLNKENLKEAIEKTLHNKLYKQNCVAMQERMAKEDGPSVALSFLEEFRRRGE